MNQADVLKTAEEAGFRKGGSVIFYDSRVMNYLPSAELTKFAELVAQREKEASARKINAVVEQMEFLIEKADSSDSFCYGTLDTGFVRAVCEETINIARGINHD